MSSGIVLRAKPAGRAPKLPTHQYVERPRVPVLVYVVGDSEVGLRGHRLARYAVEQGLAPILGSYAGRANALGPPADEITRSIAFAIGATPDGLLWICADDAIPAMNDEARSLVAAFGAGTPLGRFRSMLNTDLVLKTWSDWRALIWPETWGRR